MDRSKKISLLILGLLFVLAACAMMMFFAPPQPAAAQDEGDEGDVTGTPEPTLTQIPGCFYPPEGQPTINPEMISTVWAGECEACLEPRDPTPTQTQVPGGPTWTPIFTPTPTQPENITVIHCVGLPSGLSCGPDAPTQEVRGFTASGGMGSLTALTFRYQLYTDPGQTVRVWLRLSGSVSYSDGYGEGLLKTLHVSFAGQEIITQDINRSKTGDQDFEWLGYADIPDVPTLPTTFDVVTGLGGAHPLVGTTWVINELTVSLYPLYPEPTPMPYMCGSVPGGPETPCDLAFDVGPLYASGVLQGNDSAGDLIPLNEGDWYMIQTTGGPWQSSIFGGDRYDLAYSENGSTWREGDDFWWFDCPGNKAPHERWYFQAQGPELWIRPNDNLFFDNSGEIGWQVYSVSGDSCEANFSLEELDEYIIPGDEVVEIDGLIPGEWYAIETFGGPWQPSILGPDRYDVAVAPNNDGGDYAPFSQASPAWMSCKIRKGQHYFRGYFRAGDDAIMVKPNDSLGGDNTGEIGVRLYGSDRHFIVPVSNIIRDGNMEAASNSPWMVVDEDPGAGFVRIFNSPINEILHGRAACGMGMQIVGGGGDVGPYGGAVGQWFDWEGGRFFWQAQVKANHLEFWRGHSYVTIDVIGIVNNHWTNNITLIENYPVGRDWQTISGNLVLPPGEYRLQLFKGSLAKPGDIVYFDDIAVDYWFPVSHCGKDDGTPVEPTPTKTPTSTPTGTLTPQAPKNMISACSFDESGLWYYNSTSNVKTYGGPVGKMYADASGFAPAVWQNFTWPGGTVYLSGWVRNYTSIRAYDTQSGAIYPIKTDSYHPEWTHIERSAFLPPGKYRLELNPANNPGNHGYFDGITLSGGGFVECEIPPEPTATKTPPATPTRTSTPTMSPPELTAGAPTYTPYPGTPTDIPTYTPYPTYTQPASPTPTTPKTNTPYPTWTKQPTYTPYPTYTPRPTDTMSPPELTATADGTDIPTKTPLPYITPTPPPPPQQPAGSCLANCIRPQSGFWGWVSNPASAFAYWIDYERCQIEKYVAWCPYHQATIEAVPTMYANVEPIGSYREVKESLTTIREEIDKYDWDSTGIVGYVDGKPVTVHDQLADYGDFFDLAANSPYNGGEINIMGDSSSGASTYCEFSLEPAVGTMLASSMCFMWNTLYRLGIMPWLQLFVNLSAIGALMLYIKNAWIDKGASQG